MELSPAATARLEMGSRVIERMLNQNTFDEIAQDFKYWEDAADEYREPEGTVSMLTSQFCVVFHYFIHWFALF